MRLRLIASLPVAVVIVALLLLTASSFVSAIDRALVVETDRGPIRLVRLETHCDALFREIHALSHQATRCGDDVDACAMSPLLCAGAQDEAVEAEYRRLRDALHAQCDVPRGLLDFAWNGAAAERATAASPVDGGPYGPLVDAGGHAHAQPVCGGAHDWWENATSGQSPPSSFLF